MGGGRVGWLSGLFPFLPLVKVEDPRTGPGAGRATGEGKRGLEEEGLGITGPLLESLGRSEVSQIRVSPPVLPSS